MRVRGGGSRREGGGGKRDGLAGSWEYNGMGKRVRRESDTGRVSTRGRALREDTEGGGRWVGGFVGTTGGEAFLFAKGGGMGWRVAWGQREGRRVRPRLHGGKLSTRGQAMREDTEGGGRWVPHPNLRP